MAVRAGAPPGLFLVQVRLAVSHDLEGTVAVDALHSFFMVDIRLFADQVSSIHQPSMLLGCFACGSNTPAACLMPSFKAEGNPA